MLQKLFCVVGAYMLQTKKLNGVHFVWHPVKQVDQSCRHNEHIISTFHIYRLLPLYVDIPSKILDSCCNERDFYRRMPFQTPSQCQNSTEGSRVLFANTEFYNLIR